MVSEGVCWIFSATTASGSLIEVAAARPACVLLPPSDTLLTACLLAPIKVFRTSFAGFGLVKLDRDCSCISRCVSAIAAAAVRGAGLSLGLFPGLGEGSSWSGIGSNLAPVSGVNTCPELTGACGLKNAGAVDPALLVETSLDCTISFSDCMENRSTSGDRSSPSGNELRLAWLAYSYRVRLCRIFVW